MSNNLLISFEIMGKGMAGIFTALLVIAICVWLMQKK